MSSLITSLTAVCVAGSAHFAATQQASAPANRAQIPERYKWKLDDLFPSDTAWAEAKGGLAKKVEGFARHKGTLGRGGRAIGDTLSEMGSLRLELERVAVYAHARSDEDTREGKPRAMRAEVTTLAVALDTATAWVRPELLALPSTKIRAAMKADKRLRDWAFFLEEVLRWKPHTLPAKEERILAMAGELASAPASIYGVLKDADLPYPTIKLSTGGEVRLDPAGYARTRTSSVRADRVKVFQSFFGALKGFERTAGTMLHAQLRAHVFDKDVRGFATSLEAALFPGAIPTTIYRQLIADVNANLPVLHRYLALRQRALGLSALGYEDLYAPLVPRLERQYSIDEATAMTLAAVAPLGPDYVKQLEQGYAAGWTDFLPSTGKRAGAYSTGVYGIHPYQLLNFNGQWNDVSTLAHESGHSMHTLLAAKAQPYPTADYAIFVAEVASTLNENLLFRRSLALARTPAERLALLGERIEGLRTTLFRQTMFAEFELAIHERVEKGEALTGEALSAAYLELVRRYYGHDKGVCQVDELYGDEWIFVPHFYYDFYVYQYATSEIASTAFVRAILDDQARSSTAARDRYLAMLASGGSDQPTKLLVKAGVDLGTPAPFRAAIDEMNALMAEMESLLPAASGKPKKQ